jgi:hypothetical protein
MKATGSTSTSSLRKYATLVAGLLGAWLVLAALLLADLFPYRPSTPLGWVVLLILGVPGYILVQVLGEAGVEWLSRRFRGRTKG